MKKEYKELTLDEKVKIGKELFESFPVKYAKEYFYLNYKKDKRLFFLQLYDLLRNAGCMDSHFNNCEYDNIDDCFHNYLVWRRVEKPSYMRENNSDHYFEYEDYYHTDD